MPEVDYADSKTCPVCGESNKCTIDEKDTCWCMDKDVPKPDVEEEDACLCEECLCGNK